MGRFSYRVVEDTAKELYIRALKILPPDVREAIKRAYAKEDNTTARAIFETIFRNIEIADTQSMLICQDTDFPFILLQLEVRFALMAPKLRLPLMKEQGALLLSIPSGVVPHIPLPVKTLRRVWVKGCRLSTGILT